MNDPCRVTPADRPRPSAPSHRPEPPRDGTVLRVLLWISFTVCAVVNGVGNSIGGVGESVGLVAGIISGGSIAALIVHHYARRRS
ncbi:hypothetical protein ACFYY8_17940 [Streptosporangium sp. NPDC001559]|uniref:hypothetical protein n=1 Tax=Streptosporangium sp. NPDC001559 TaxID=3366187 RepID=UPI0036E7195F